MLPFVIVLFSAMSPVSLIFANDYMSPHFYLLDGGCSESSQSSSLINFPTILFMEAGDVPGGSGGPSDQPGGAKRGIDDLCLLQQILTLNVHLKPTLCIFLNPIESTHRLHTKSSLCFREKQS